MSVKSSLSAPPLIRAKRVPTWLFVRDLLLTAMAWVVIAQSMRQGLYIIFDCFSPPAFELTRAKFPHLVEIWVPLKEFLFIAIGLVVWLALWSLHGTRRLRTKSPARYPVPLSDGEHASMLGMKEDQLAQWRRYRIVVVTFENGNQITAVLRRDSEFTVAAATG